MELILNLDSKFVENYWKNKDKNFYQLLSDASKLESWTLSYENNLKFKSKLTEFTKIAKDFPTKEWSSNSKEVTEIMALLPLLQFISFLHYLDLNFPGLSFHFIIEAKQSKIWLAGQLLIKRLQLVKEWKCLNMVFTPMRTRLISALLNDDKDD